MFARLKRALLTWPSPAQWLDCLVIGCAGLAVIGGIAWEGGLIYWQPDLQNWSLRLLSVLCVPAFSEELVFRGLLVPDRGETHRPVLWIGGAVVVFMLWHVVEAVFILPGARLFLQPVFLMCAGLLGLACALMRYRTGSLWPAVMLHGVLVWLWQSLFGGPDVRQLLG